MIGLRRMARDDGAEVLRAARGSRLGQASDTDYRHEIQRAEKALNG